MKTAKLYAGITVDPARAAALAELHRLVGQALEQDGARIPCCGPDRDLWLSDDRAEQEAAADHCLDCPLFVDCLAYARAWPERGAVWAGIPPSRPGRRSSTNSQQSKGLMTE